MAEGQDKIISDGKNLELRNGPSNRDVEAIIGNMFLAHEMIVDDDFKLEGFKENTLEKAVRDVVHKAFWDVLEEQLSEDPPRYERAVSLLAEIKEILLSLMLPQNAALKEQVDEVLDMELIKQEIENKCFELEECAKFIIIIMGRLCAPQRDEELKKLRDLEGIVPKLRGILEFLDLMKLDMANFQLEKLKPILMQQAVEYERGKFQQFLNANPDGTASTKKWLKLAIQDVKKLIMTSSHRQSPEKPIRPIARITPPLVLTHAYLKLLDWQDDLIIPETLQMDELRLAEMSHMFSRLCLIGSLMLITSNTIARQLSGDAEYIMNLKDHLFVLLDGVPNRKLPGLLPNLYEQIIKETKGTYEERNIPYKDNENESDLKKQILNLLKEGNSVHNLIRSRMRDYVLLCMTSEKSPKHNEAPLALKNIQDELKIFAGRFARIIIHNRNVYAPVYNEIINSLLNEICEDESENGDID